MALSQDELRRIAEEQLEVATAKAVPLLTDATFRPHEDYPKHGIKIFRRSDPETKIEIFRAHATIKRPLPALFAACDSGIGRARWDKSYLPERSRVIDEWDHPKFRRCVYYHEVQGSMLGGLISARDLVNVRYSTLSDDEALFVFAAADGALQPPLIPNSVRAWLYPSAMHIKKLSDNECAYTAVLHPDPRGNIPNWAVVKAIGQSFVDQILHYTTYTPDN